MRPRVTQIGVAMMAMLALLIGMATMNASASYPSRSLSQGITNGTDPDIAKQIAAGQPLVRAAEHADVSIPLRDYAERITEGVQPKENENPIAHRRDPGKPVPSNF